VLNAFARKLNPLLPAISAAADYGGYYWVLDQAEIAIDVMFNTRGELLKVWPDLVRHASLNMSSEDVLGFLGRKLHPSLAAEVITDTKRRTEGWRVRHRMAGNWIKTYDKASVLRVVTVINNPREFRILRVKTDDKGRRVRRWCPMKKGVGDLWRSFQVEIGANRRHLDALAGAPLKGEGVTPLDALCGPRTNHGRHVARFNPSTPTTSRSSAPSSPANTPSSASATTPSPSRSTGDHPPTATRPIDDANASHGSSSSCADTASWPRCHALASTASHHTASASWPPPSPSTTTAIPTTTSPHRRKPDLSLATRKSCDHRFQRRVGETPHTLVARCGHRRPAAPTRQNAEARDRSLFVSRGVSGRVEAAPWARA
jgi:hypothetical protein